MPSVDVADAMNVSHPEPPHIPSSYLSSPAEACKLPKLLYLRSFVSGGT